jgi:hypothetical protein
MKLLLIQFFLAYYTSSWLVQTILFSKS